MSTETESTGVLRFGVFELDTRTGELRKSGTLIKLQPQPLKVLALLASRQGELVTREEIQQQVWGGETFVDFEQGLNYCIRQIRDALGDDADSPRYVETLPRRGYRFLVPAARSGPMTAEDTPPQEAAREKVRAGRWAAVIALGVVLVAAGFFVWKRVSSHPAAPAGKVMLAVLPFDNLSNDPEQEYFSDGLTDEAISQLGRLHPQGLSVIARTSAMQYKNTRKTTAEIGRELRVDYVLEGSVRRDGNRVRITVNLVQVSDETPVWTESYERDLRDILALQANVASAIAGAIRLNLTAKQQALLQSPPTVKPGAYEAYLKGVYFWGKRSDQGLRLAVDHYQQAIAEDPNYAPAHAGLAMAYASTTFWGIKPPAEIIGKIEQAATRAIELDETLPAAHAAMGLAYTWKRDSLAAEREYQRSIELNPAYAFAHQMLADTLRAAGRTNEALAELERARESDPLSLIINNAIGWHLYLARRYNPAIAQFQKTLQLDANFALAHFDLGRAYEAKGMLGEALAEFQKAKDLSEGSPFTLGGLGHCYGVAGQKDKAREVLAELRSLARQRYVSPLDVAFVYIGLDEKVRAFEWLEKARVEQAPWLAYLRDDPVYDPLRSDPRFQEIVGKTGLPTAEKSGRRR